LLVLSAVFVLLGECLPAGERIAIGRLRERALGPGGPLSAPSVPGGPSAEAAALLMNVPGAGMAPGNGRQRLVVGPQVPGGPPKRPRHFKSVQELHDYLEALRDYYAVLGRPRFGRSVRNAQSSSKMINLSNDVDLENNQEQNQVAR